MGRRTGRGGRERRNRDQGHGRGTRTEDKDGGQRRGTRTGEGASPPSPRRGACAGPPRQPFGRRKWPGARAPPPDPSRRRTTAACPAPPTHRDGGRHPQPKLCRPPRAGVRRGGRHGAPVDPPRAWHPRDASIPGPARQAYRAAFIPRAARPSELFPLGKAFGPCPAFRPARAGVLGQRGIRTRRQRRHRCRLPYLKGRDLLGQRHRVMLQGLAHRA